MFSMDRTLGLRLPVCILFVMYVLIGCQVIHLLVENLGPLDWIVAIEMCEHGGVPDRVHSEIDESFVLPSLFGTNQHIRWISLDLRATCSLKSLSILPVLPPPKLLNLV